MSNNVLSVLFLVPPFVVCSLCVEARWCGSLAVAVNLGLVTIWPWWRRWA